MNDDNSRIKADSKDKSKSRIKYETKAKTTYRITNTIYL